MEKIKTIRQLASEKERLKKRQAELEKLIAADWAELKTAAKPVNIIKRTVGKNATENNTKKGKPVLNVLSAIATQFVPTLLKKVGRFFPK